MISDEKISKICLIIAVVGAAGIGLANIYHAPEEMAIGMIGEEDLGKMVKISGSIISFSTTNGNIFIWLDDKGGNISVVMFERTARDQKYVYELKKGDNITVSGKVSLYKTDLEVLAETIKRMQN
jgi:DNA/RNA endonuclease YhcR with UshA esterase domain